MRTPRRRAFGASEAAVSPVMGVILMVAITVVLAGTVFLIVNGMGKGKDPAPVVATSHDERTGRVQVIRADAGLDLHRLQIKMPVAGHFGYNGAASLASTALPADTYVPLAATTGSTLTGGDTIEVCVNSAASNVAVTLQDPVTNAVLGQQTFATLSVCA